MCLCVCMCVRGWVGVCKLKKVYGRVNIERIATCTEDQKRRHTKDSERVPILGTISEKAPLKEYRPISPLHGTNEGLRNGVMRKVLQVYEVRGL